MIDNVFFDGEEIIVIIEGQIFLYLLLYLIMLFYIFKKKYLLEIRFLIILLKLF